MQIEEYRTQLEKFRAALNREVYLHTSGQVSGFDVERVYADFCDLFSLETICEIKLISNQHAEPFSSRQRSLTKILAFALEQYLDSAVCGLTREIAEFEASRRFKWEESEVAFFQITPCLANEPDFGRRRRLNEFKVEVLDESRSLREERIRLLQARSKTVGHKDYLAALTFATGIDYLALSKSLETLLEATQAAFIDRLREEIGKSFSLPWQDIRRCDLIRWIRSCEPPGVFSSAALQGLLRRTISDLGVEPERPDAITFDLGHRPMKQARASCIPIRVPYEIKVVLVPGDGYDCYAAFMHEAGHAHRLAWTSPALPAEYRLCGDPGVSETYAFIFESLLRDSCWIRLNFESPRVAPFLGCLGLYELYEVRSQVGRLRYGIHLYSEGGLTNAPDVFAEIMERCTGIVHEPETCFEDSEVPMDAADYLRGWIAAAMLEEHLRLRFGRDWFKSRAAGAFFKELWETGNQYRTEELCREIGLGDLDVQALTHKLREGLRQ